MPSKPHHTADISTAIWKAPLQLFPFMSIIGEAVSMYTHFTFIFVIMADSNLFLSGAADEDSC